MSDYSQLVPEHVRNLGGYTPGKSLRQAQQESRVNCIKMASNENPFGPSPLAVKAMQSVISESNFYPDNDAGELRQRLADHHKLQPEQIVPTAGSTALLGIIARTLLSPGLNAITSERSFIVYPIATQAAGGQLIRVPTLDDGFDLNMIAAAIDPHTRIIYISNPNNPTGTLLCAAELDRFIDRMPEHVIVILDEAYYDFAQDFAAVRSVDYSHALDYVKQGRRVVVLRTFSKVHGLAGVRVGYGIGPSELMSYFARMRTTFSVSAVAQAGAMAALEDQAHIRKTIRNNSEQAERLIAKMTDLGYRPVPTWANFIYCDLGDDAAAVATRLQAEGVIVRPLGPWGAPSAIRITIGIPEQNDIFLNAFRKVMERASVR
ncbi:MAG TPA: histidinol-phosphate transaminase [Terriglobales bacterium]|jgi:histidinol-phosphate aminotransferase|nr:histidinol-phosphate transaminase [Terriglobales bacterium]